MKCAYCDTLFYHMQHCPACGAPAPVEDASPQAAPALPTWQQEQAARRADILKKRNKMAGVLLLCTGIPGAALMLMMALMGFFVAGSSFEVWIAALCVLFAGCFALPVAAGVRSLAGKGGRLVVLAAIVLMALLMLVRSSGISVLVLLTGLSFLGAVGALLLHKLPVKLP